MSELSHHCDGSVLVCMDWRLFQSGQLSVQLKELAQVKDFDLVGLAGATKNLVDLNTQDFVLRHFTLSKDLHRVKKIILTNHTDCGAYGQEGTEERLIEDLKKGREILREKYPDLETVLVLIVLSAGNDQWQTDCRLIE